MRAPEHTYKMREATLPRFERTVQSRPFDMITGGAKGADIDLDGSCCHLGVGVPGATVAITRPANAAHKLTHQPAFTSSFLVISGTRLVSLQLDTTPPSVNRRSTPCLLSISGA